MIVLKTLRARLLLSYIGLVLITLLLAAAILASGIRVYQDRLTLIRLSGSVRFTVPFVAERWQQGMEPQAILDEFKANAPGPIGRVLILSPRGEVLADTGRSFVGKQVGRLRPIIHRLPSPVREFRGEFRAANGERWLCVAVPLIRNPSQPALRQRPLLVAHVAPAQDQVIVLDLARQLAKAGLGALIVGVLLALVISRSIAQPLREIASATREIAHGDLDQQLAVGGPDEVQSLARSFNTMVREVKATRQAQRALVANVSHDLKTPLTSIQGFSQAILDGMAQDEATLKRLAGVIHDEATRMHRLVEQLLDLARLDAGQVVMRGERVALEPLLQGCVESLAVRAQEKEITLSLNVPQLPIILGDGDRLMQVFTNLLDNALKHTPNGGTITVEGSVVEVESVQGDGHQPMVEISVTDTGPGIPPEDLPHIFERFYQVDKSRPGGRGGSGLGLAIVKEIVEAHGGHVHAESVVGLGSRFIVALPLPEENSQ